MYSRYRFNFRMFFSIFSPKKCDSFFQPIEQLQDCIQSIYNVFLSANIFTKRRCKNLQKLKGKIHDLLAYKQYYLRPPPLSFCDFISKVVFNDNPIEYDYCLSYKELDTYNLPPLIQPHISNIILTQSNLMSRLSLKTTNTMPLHQTSRNSVSKNIKPLSCNGTLRKNTNSLESREHLTSGNIVLLYLGIVISTRNKK